MAEIDLRYRLSGLSRGEASSPKVQPLAAVIAGLLAGLVLLLMLEFLAVVIYDEPPWKLFRAIAAMVFGPDTLEPDDEYQLGAMALGLGLHFSFSVLYALAFCRLLVEFPSEVAPWLGMLFGVVLYSVDLYGFSNLFPWLSAMRSFDTLVSHALFGL